MMLGYIRKQYIGYFFKSIFFGLLEPFLSSNKKDTRINVIFLEFKTSKRSEAPLVSTFRRWFDRLSRWKNRLEDL